MDTIRYNVILCDQQVLYDGRRNLSDKRTAMTTVICSGPYCVRVWKFRLRFARPDNDMNDNVCAYGERASRLPTTRQNCHFSRRRAYNPTLKITRPFAGKTKRNNTVNAHGENRPCATRRFPTFRNRFRRRAVTRSVVLAHVRAEINIISRIRRAVKI